MPPALQAPDDRLVARLLSRESRAWEELLAEYGGLISGTCRKTLSFCGLPGDASAVADASAETVRALLEDDLRLLRRFRPGASLAAYLRVIARSRTLDVARRLVPNPSGLGRPSPDRPSDMMERLERVERLKGALAALPARDAEALHLFHLKGMSYAEVSTRTGVPEGQVGTLLVRARERLRQVLGPDFPDFL